MTILICFDQYRLLEIICVVGCFWSPLIYNSMSWGVILPGWAEMEVGERVTVGVVFINSLLSSSSVFSYWSDISQGDLRKIFTAYYCKWLIIPHKYSLKHFNLGNLL